MVPQEVERWCERNGWTEPVLKQGKYYAFAPNVVVPQPIPAWWNIPVWLHLDQLQQRGLLLSLFVIFYFIALLLCSFLWSWRGIWSVYLSQVENQKFLACHYCPTTPGVLVEMKNSSQGLQEVQSEFLSKTTLRVTDYSGSKEVTKLVSREEVKGRVLHLFNPECRKG